MKTVKWILFIALLVGCSSGFDKESVNRRLNGGSIVVDAAKLQETAALKRELTFPIRLGVFFDSSVKNSKWRWDWDWTLRDRDALMGIKEELQNFEVVVDIIYIPESVVSGWSSREIKLAAARYKVDTLLVIKGVPSVDAYHNPWSVLYSTFFGMWLAPGSNRDALFKIEGDLWDVATDYLYFSWQTEGRSKVQRPIVYITDWQAISIAKTAAIKRFALEFKEKIKGVAGVEEEIEKSPNQSGSTEKGVNKADTKNEKSPPQKDSDR